MGTAPVVDTSSDHGRRHPRQRDARQRLPVGRAFTDTLYMRPRRQRLQRRRQRQPVDRRRQRPREQLRRRRRQHHERGLRRASASYSIVLRLAGHAASPPTSSRRPRSRPRGFEAEYGQATGGVVNVVTTSGSNTFHGSRLRLLPARRPWRASWKQLQTRRTAPSTRPAARTATSGSSLGGPIVKDKLFFFGTFNPQYETRTLIAPDGLPAARAWARWTASGKTYSYAGKLTWQANADHRFDVYRLRRPVARRERPAARRRCAGSRGHRPGSASSLDYGGHNQALRYDGIISPNWLVEASVGPRHEQASTERPSIDELDRHRPHAWCPTSVTRRHRLLREGQQRHEPQFTLKSTNIFNAAGSHQLRYGVGYEDIDYTQRPQSHRPQLHAARRQPDDARADRSRSGPMPSSAGSTA